jgi:hypothetical protein
MLRAAVPVLLLLVALPYASAACACSSAPCPVDGVNTLTVAKGTAQATYDYVSHNGVPVISVRLGHTLSSRA